jgi:hypothetical protein
MTFATRDLGPHTGTEIRSDIATLLSGAYAKDIRRLLEDRVVLVFPQIGMTDAEQSSRWRSLITFVRHGGIYDPAGKDCHLRPRRSPFAMAHQGRARKSPEPRLMPHRSTNAGRAAVCVLPFGVTRIRPRAICCVRRSRRRLDPLRLSAWVGCLCPCAQQRIRHCERCKLRGDRGPNAWLWVASLRSR